MIPVSSLSARLLISVSLLLVFFFGVTIVVLDAAFRETGEQAQEDILDGQLMALLAAAEPNSRGELENRQFSSDKVFFIRSFAHRRIQPAHRKTS